MNFDYEALREAQEQAAEQVEAGSVLVDAAGNEIVDGNGVPKFSIDPVPTGQISAPAVIAQELEFTTATATYRFEFGSRAPDPAFPPAGAIQFNNVQLGENDTFCLYGIRFYLGVGENASDRIYRTTGVVSDDDVIYNGNVSMKFASSEPVKFFSSKNFRDSNLFQPYAGFNFVRPVRTFTGSLSNLIVTLELPDVSTLVFTPNSVLRMELEGAIGVA